MSRSFLTATVCLFAMVSTTFASTWTDSTGKYKVDAEFVKLDNNTVQLKRADGLIVDVPLNKLSNSDQSRARRLAQSSTTTTEQPSQNPSTQSTPKSTSPKLSQIETTGKARWSNEISFNSKGKQLPPKLELCVESKGPPAADAAAYGQVKFNGATVAGKKLKRAKTFFAEDDISNAFEKVERSENDFFNDHPENGLLIPVGFQNPGNSAKTASFAGTLKLRTGGEKHTVVVPNVAKSNGLLKDKLLQQAKVVVKITITKGKTIVATITGNIAAVDKVALTDNQGKEISDIIGQGVAEFGKQQEYDFDFEKSIPSNAQLNIYLRTNLEEVEVPFQFDNVSVTKQDH
jgi:hypothetical protein